jgi:hypothetical protein
MSSVEPVGVHGTGPLQFGAAHIRRYFYLGMIALAALIVFVGFAPTFYLGGFFHAPALPSLLVIHGTIFSSWMVLLLAQSLLVRTGNVQVHRRLGMAGAVLAAAMVGIGIRAALVGAANGTLGARVNMPPLEFLIVPLGQILLFGALTTAAILLRRRPEAHRRLMIIATIQLVAPAIVRAANAMFHVMNPVAALVVAGSMVAACIAFDVFTRRRVHPVFAVVAPLTLLSFPMRIAFSHTATWHSIAEWLVRGVSQ